MLSLGDFRLLNPWLALPSVPEYVLPMDKPYVSAANHKIEPGHDHWINLNHTPEPRLGPIGAPVILLQLNPSYSRHELNGRLSTARRDRDLESVRDDEHSHLGVTEHDEWWNPRLRQLISDVGEKQLAAGLCSIEFFPYRSRAFSHGCLRLPSQEYTFSIVRAGIRRGAIFIITRNYRLWISAVPELHGQLNKTVYVLNNPRSSYLTDTNLPRNVYPQLVAAISRVGGLDSERE